VVKSAIIIFIEENYDAKQPTKAVF